ncbi:MAG: hypothetical protein WCK07_18965 [Betaproteobacteria bacterium]|jgi:hypothetical protein
MKSAACLLLLLFASCCAAAPFEIKIHDELIAPYQESVYETEAHVYRAPSSQALKSSVVQTRLEYAYGVTRASEWSINAFLSNYAGNNELNGGKIAHLYIPEHDEDGWFHYGIKNEINTYRPLFAPQQVYYEITPILALQTAQWRLTLNPSLDYYFKGGHHWELAPGARLAYRLTRETSVGVEYYSEMGPLRNLTSVSQRPDMAYLVLDTKRGNSSFHFGLGKGVNAVSDQWVFKFIGAFEFK